MEERIGATGLGLAALGLLLLAVPIIGWGCYALGLLFSVWGIFRPRPRLAWWGVFLSVASVVLRLTVAIFVVG